jgi:uncharacterized protein YbaR (Trm112 family)
MQAYLLEWFECPRCQHKLDMEIEERNIDHIEQAQARCAGCGTAYPVREGIGIFLTPNLPRNALWEQVESQLGAYLRDPPELERRLMDPPVEELSPTDQQFRAQLLEEQGEFAKARQAEELAMQNLYTPVYNRCWQSQVEYTLELTAAREGPIVDLASRRGRPPPAGSSRAPERTGCQLHRPSLSGASCGRQCRNRWHLHLGAGTVPWS